jgi:hypothetical protein
LLAVRRKRHSTPLARRTDAHGYGILAAWGAFWSALGAFLFHLGGRIMQLAPAIPTALAIGIGGAS